MNKAVYKYSDIKDKIIHAIDTIADPIKQTLSPRGANVIFEDDNGNQYVTNDGVTIAKNISVEDPVEDSFIQIIKHSALKTNAEAGDGTSTSILLSQNLIKSGLKLVEEGYNPIELKKEFEAFGKKLIENVEANTVKIKDDKELKYVATISANNDTDIASDVVKVVKITGEDGLVFIEPNSKDETEIIEDIGFVIHSGMLSPELRNHPSKFIATHKDVPVLVTDKRIYYPEEAETILATAISAGHKAVVIVARDFIGQSINTFIANHARGKIQVLLVKDTNATDKDAETLHDLAVYLGTNVISEKVGSLVNKLSIEDFGIAESVMSDAVKTLIVPKQKTSKELRERVSAIKDSLDASKNKPEEKELKRRLSSLTNGMVTIKVGGATPMETMERIYRYEDAVNATREAMKDGYVVGGGTTLLRAYNQKDYKPELAHVFKKFCEASIRQISINCGKHQESVIENILSNKNKNFGYNALTDTFEDLLKAGVIEPAKVTKMTIQNSISVTNVIISSNYLITNVKDKERGDKDGGK